MKPNPKLIDMWTRAATMYHDNLPGSPAEDYLASRGLLDGAEMFMLGWVKDPAPGHDASLTGMLSIPYITQAGVIGFKMRRLGAGDPKYLAPTGQRQHLYNVQAILDSVEQILIVEGELDAVSATLAGFPAVAVPGVNGWRPHFSRCFDGIGKVIIITDNDDKADGTNPGQDLAKKLVEQLPAAVRVSLPKGHDINSTILSHGAQHLADLVGAIE